MPSRGKRLEVIVGLGAVLLAASLPSAAADRPGRLPLPTRIHAVKHGDQPWEGTGGWVASAIRQAFMDDLPPAVGTIVSHLLPNTPVSSPGLPPVQPAPPPSNYSTGNAAMVNPNG